MKIAIIKKRKTYANGVSGLIPTEDIGNTIGNFIDDKTTDDEGFQKAGMAGLSKGISGAGTGAKIGGMFGPIGSAVGAGIGAIGGFISGAIGQKKENEERRIQKFAARNSRDKALLESYNQNGYEDANYFALGGSGISHSGTTNLNGTKILASDMREAKGRTHEEGGINKYGVNIEDKEVVRVRDRDMDIYSDRIMFDKKQSIAKVAKKLSHNKGLLEGGISTDESKRKINIIDSNLDNLVEFQEAKKTGMFKNINGKIIKVSSNRKEFLEGATGVSQEDVQTGTEDSSMNLPIGTAISDSMDLIGNFITTGKGEVTDNKHLSKIQRPIDNSVYGRRVIIQNNIPLVKSFGIGGKSVNPQELDLPIEDYWNLPEYQRKQIELNSMEKKSLDKIESSSLKYDDKSTYSSFEPVEVPQFKFDTYIPSFTETTDSNETKSKNPSDVGVNDKFLNTSKFFDNAVNAGLTAMTPRVPQARTLNPIPLKTDFDISSALQSIKNKQRAFESSVDSVSSSGNSARAVKLAAFSEAIGQANQLFTTKTNQETQLINANKINVQQVQEQNLQKLADQDFKEFLRKNDIQDRISRNVADGIGDIHNIEKEANMKDYDKQVLALNSQLVEATNVDIRNNMSTYAKYMSGDTPTEVAFREKLKDRINKMEGKEKEEAVKEFNDNFPKDKI